MCDHHQSRASTPTGALKCQRTESHRMGLGLRMGIGMGLGLGLGLGMGMEWVTLGIACKRQPIHSHTLVKSDTNKRVVASQTPKSLESRRSPGTKSVDLTLSPPVVVFVCVCLWLATTTSRQTDRQSTNGQRLH